MSKSIYEYGHGSEQKDRNLEQTAKDKEFKRPFIAAIIVALIILAIIIVVVLIRTPWSGKEVKTSSSGELSEEHPQDGAKQYPISVKQYERDGQLYELRTYDWFDIEVPINNMTVVAKEEIAYMPGLSGQGGLDIPNYMKEIIADGESRYMPKLFDNTDEILFIEYTAQNGCCAFDGIDKGSRSMKYDYQHFKSEPKMISASEQETTKLYFFLEFNIAPEGTGTGKYPSHYETGKAVKEELHNTIIKADLTYLGGEKETVYIGMEIQGEYNTNSVHFYRLTME